MTQSSLREKFARLGPTQAINLVPSGSPEILILSLGPELAHARTIDATYALRRRGVQTIKAKRAVEAAVRGESVALVVPTVENAATLASEMTGAGFKLSFRTPKSVDVKTLRERLNLTQEQFALRYGLELDAVRNWEYGRREPDTAAKSYLRVIEHDPEAVQEALAIPVP